ncbi:hypothetical protein [Aeromonas veronii]|uniref:hypothetical protein n=1 Tax=Aeromonas veronii TaxID=654 RepID=UPI003D1EF0FD
MAGWEGLSKGTQDVYVNLGTRNDSVIIKIKTKHLVKAIRESQFVGYDDGAPYRWLMFEYERRKTQRTWLLGIAGLIVTAFGVVVAAFSIQGG